MIGRGFDGATIVLFESRMSQAMAKSIASHGGQALCAPSMREVPLAENAAAFAFVDRLLRGEIDLVLFMTGVGTRILLKAVAAQRDLAPVLDALSRVTVVARGPKPAAALREYRIPISIAVPEPNTWREIIQTLDEHERGVALEGRTLAIQEYGVSNERLMQALKARGATLLPVPVYQWALPEDTGPLVEGIRALTDGRAEGAIFTSAQQVHHVLQMARREGLDARLRQAWERRVVASIGPTTSETLRDEQLGVDFEPSHPKMGVLIDEFADRWTSLRAGKDSPAVSMSRPTVPPANAASSRRDSVFLKACRREPANVTPVWLMRQAGRYMESYRQIRNRVSFLELCKRPELVAQVTVDAAQRLGVDAAIIFSDILLIVEPFGLGLEYTSDEGPVISGEPLTREGIDRLPELEPAESLAFVYEGMRQTRAALDASLPLLGFAGAPFTLAAYILEGGGSKTFLNTKRLMYADAGAWHALMAKISRGLVKHLNGQIDAGADAVQLFDSWVGCVSPSDYETLVAPHTRAVIQGVQPGVPVIHFGTGTGAFLPAMRTAGGDVIGVDFRVELDEAWRVLGPDVGIQGNLDPALLCAPIERIRDRARRILDQATGRPGHIFNLGHGVLPSTPEAHAKALVEIVHELSRR